MAAVVPDPVTDRSTPGGSIAEYYRLQYVLLGLTGAIALVVCLGTWLYFSLNTAGNYLLGALVGMVYLKLLARGAERLGSSATSLGRSHIMLFVGLFVLASRLPQLQLLPAILGFLTYKVALLGYTLYCACTSEPS